MSPDDFQQAWQASSSQSRLRIDADLLVKELQRNQRQFDFMIFARDIREVVVALTMIPVWLFLGWAWALPWAWYLVIPGLVFVAAFMIFDRFRHSQRPPEPDASMREQISHSLAQVDHQIWLLRKVFWWYLLPLALPCGAFFAQVAWKMRALGWVGALTALVTISIFGSIMGFVYWLNQKAVRCGLEPRRQELKTLLSSFGDESDS
jgi:hypothetical protein